MPIYRYVGYAPDGQPVRGRKTAPTEEEARLQLEDDHIEVEALDRVWWDVPLTLRRKVTSKDLLVFVRHLASLVKSRMTTAQALDVLYRQTASEPLRRVIMELAIQVRSHAKLSVAMAQHPEVFDQTFVEMVAVGERTGSLDRMLTRLGDKLKRTQKIKARVRRASIYPIVLLGTVVVVGGFLIVYVVPKFAEIFRNGGYELPQSTLFLIGVSEIVRGSGPYLLLGLAGMVAYVPRFLYRASLRDAVDAVMFRIPVIRRFTLNGALANYCMTLDMALASGIPLLTSVQMSADMLDNRRVAAALRQAATELQSHGSRLAPALERTRLFPADLIARTAVGEKAGDLQAQMQDAADFYEDEVLDSTDQLLAYLEPALIIIASLFVGALLLGVYNPMFQAIRYMSE